MTAITASMASVTARPVTWRRLVWVSWRQQRAILLAALAVMVGVALILLLSGLAIHHTAARLGTGWWIRTRSTGYYSWTDQLPLALQAMPILIGAFVGAPLLAREAEAGTFRFAWTQGTGRMRLLIAHLVLPVVVLTTAAAAFGVLFDWWFAPLTDNVSLARYDTSAVDLFPPSLVGWVLFGILLGVLAGAVLRQTVLAMGATMAGYVVLAYVAATRLRAHYLAPLSGRLVSSGQSVDILNQYTAWPDGRPLSNHDLLQNTTWDTQHHIVSWAVYQPASRFWPFQWIEFGWLTLLALLLAGATAVIMHRRTA